VNQRAEVLDAARSAVLEDRNNSYGPPHQDFQRTADALTALGFRAPDEGPISAHHVAMMMIILKSSRLTWNPLKMDSWIDIAGYAACGFEAAALTVTATTPPEAS
jgi:hypothetical protein